MANKKKTKYSAAPRYLRAAGLVFGTVFFGYLLCVVALRFADGEPMGFRFHQNARRHFHAYGEGAFATDHIGWLIVSSWLLPFVVGFVFALVSRSQYRSVIAGLYTVLYGASLAAITAIALNIFYINSGVSHRNFMPETLSDHSGVMYALNFALPVASLVMVAVLIWGKKTGRMVLPKRDS